MLAFKLTMFRNNREVMRHRYQDSKRASYFALFECRPNHLIILVIVLNVLFTRAFASLISGSSPVIINCLDPGYCESDLRRHLPADLRTRVEGLEMHTTEEGSRQLIWAAIGGQGREDELRGAYISQSDIVEPNDCVLGEQGKVIQDRIWVRDRLCSRGSHVDESSQRETIDILSKVLPRVASIVQRYGEM
jgi:hypothetical protein